MWECGTTPKPRNPGFSFWRLMRVQDSGLDNLLGKANIKVFGVNILSTFSRTIGDLFGNPEVVRLDPAGAFRSNMLDDYFSSRGIMVDHIAAEAHWQIPLVERSIQTTKNMMGCLFEEFPDMRIQEMFARVLWAQNTRDQYLGFSPLQHVLGRNPDEGGRLFHSEQSPLPVLTERAISAEFGRDASSLQKG